MQITDTHRPFADCPRCIPPSSFSVLHFVLIIPWHIFIVILTNNKIVVHLFVSPQRIASILRVETGPYSLLNSASISSTAHTQWPSFLLRILETSKPSSDREEKERTVIEEEIAKTGECLAPLRLFTQRSSTSMSGRNILPASWVLTDMASW